MSAEPGVNGGALQCTDIASPQHLGQSPVSDDGLEEGIKTLANAVKTKGRRTNALVLLATGSGGIVSGEDLPGRLRISDPRLGRNHKNQLSGAGFLIESLPTHTWEAPTNLLSLAALMQLQNMRANGAPVFVISAQAVEAARSWLELGAQKAELRLMRAQLAARSALQASQAGPAQLEGPSLPLADPSAGPPALAEPVNPHLPMPTRRRKRHRVRSLVGQQNQANGKAARSRKRTRVTENAVAVDILKGRSATEQSNSRRVARAVALSSRKSTKAIRRLKALVFKQNATGGRLLKALRRNGKAVRRRLVLHSGKGAKVKSLRYRASSGLRRGKVTMQEASRARP